MNGEHCKITSAKSCSQFFAVRRSPENPAKIACKSAVVANWYLTQKPACDIGLYHAALLHGPSREDARVASAQFAAIDPREADSIPTAATSRQVANPTLDTDGRKARTRGNSQEVKNKRACRLFEAADKP
jgi:hypothetical protein